MNKTDLCDNPDSFPDPEEAGMYLDDWEPEEEADETPIDVPCQGVVVSPDFERVQGQPPQGTVYTYQITRAIEREFVGRNMQRAAALSEEFTTLMTNMAAAICQDAGIPFTVGEDKAEFVADQDGQQMTLVVTEKGLTQR